jgi:hypothetical protein
VCVADAAGLLRSITEQTNIVAADIGPGPGKKFSGDEVVSMNCWGFTPALFGALDAQLREFLAARGGDAKAEFYLPAAVSEQIARGQTGVRVLPTASAWFGVTYRADKPRVATAIAELVRGGVYPASLWS